MNITLRNNMDYNDTTELTDVNVCEVEIQGWELTELIQEHLDEFITEQQIEIQDEAIQTNRLYHTTN